MTTKFTDTDAVWRRCEIAWSTWLQADHYAVTHLGEAHGNTTVSGAPLIEVGGRRRRAPDLHTTKAGRGEYWEVKFRTRSEVDPLTGSRVHWMSYAAFRDYLAVAQGTNSRLWVVLYEAPTSLGAGRWLRARIQDLRDAGRRTSRIDQSGGRLDAWEWPVSSMEVVTGPKVDMSAVQSPLLVREGEGAPIPEEAFEPMEREVRRRPRDDRQDATEQTSLDDPVLTVLDDNYSVGLEVLRRSLGIPAPPRYSVLRITSSTESVDDLLGLLHYGIRVFLVTSTECPHRFDPRELQAFRESRLLEWAILPEVAGEDYWVVDGAMPDPAPRDLAQALHAADEAGGINLGQYKIVHADASANVLVTAGAGTGKTETMSERLVFLLATSAAGAGAGGASSLSDLRVDDVVLMTFTREAAREMRERLARTLMLRQRLSRRCVLPALAWLMQLSGAQVTTIHSYAKRIVQSGAGALGLPPNFSVSKQTLAFRELLQAALSPRLEHLLEGHKPELIPPVHAWQRHIETVWEALANNGVNLMPLDGVSSTSDVEWGSTSAGVMHQKVVDATTEVVQELALSFKAHCLETQCLPTASLVPAAVETINVTRRGGFDAPRYLFVDEFQDTDALQMELVLDLSQKMGANLFMVGDAKQGIYRFRGAEGNAFEELRKRVDERKMSPIKEFALTRNFRSGESLLNSLHPVFMAWGSGAYLSYDEGSRLRPQLRPLDSSLPISFETVKTRDFDVRAARLVKVWREKGPQESIAILCRRNWQAVAVQSAVRQAGGSCELLVGGSFYTTPAVRELRALLEVVASPSDNAALLEICETRWAAGILRGEPPVGVSADNWRVDVCSPMAWSDRLASLSGSQSFNVEDLELLRRRVISLGAMLSRTSVMAWIVECARSFVPEASALPILDDATERARYARCFDHLVTLLDAQFQDSPATLERVLTWLKLQIATNETEDEPVVTEALAGRTTALTVHKAKGLEFDRVLIPTTWTSFAPPKSVPTQASVLRREAQIPRLVWDWRAGTTGGSFTNVMPEEQGLWATNDLETAREEARLLYVALTRAKDELRLYTNRDIGGPVPQPNSWADLLSLGSW